MSHRKPKKPNSAAPNPNPPSLPANASRNKPIIRRSVSVPLLRSLLGDHANPIRPPGPGIISVLSCGDLRPRRSSHRSTDGRASPCGGAFRFLNGVNIDVLTNLYTARPPVGRVAPIIDEDAAPRRRPICQSPINLCHTRACRYIIQATPQESSGASFAQTNANPK